MGWESRVGGRGGQRRESVNIENHDNWRIRTAKNVEIRSTVSKRKKEKHGKARQNETRESKKHEIKHNGQREERRRT